MSKNTFAPKIVLQSTQGYKMSLDALVEQFLAGGVKCVCVVGQDCQLVEDIIDELVVGDGSDPSRFLLTSSHADESLEEAIAFAEFMSDEYAGPVQVIEL